MSGYAFHPDAFADLDEIWEYIAQDTVDAADRRNLRLMAATLRHRSWNPAVSGTDITGRLAVALRAANMEPESLAHSAEVVLRECSS